MVPRRFGTRSSDKIDDQEDDVRMQDAVTLKVIKQVLADKRVSASEAQYALANGSFKH